jgi:hypothetical protein
MSKHAKWHGILPLAVLLALLLAAISPQIAFAEGDTPEIPPSDGSITEPPGEEDVVDSVSSLSDANAIIVDGSGDAVPLASKSAMDVLCDPDPWFFCSACAGGISYNTTISGALSNWVALKGYGMIFVEGGYAVAENITINGSVAGFNTLTGIVRQIPIALNTPIIVGNLEVYNMAAGFTLSDLTIIATYAGPVIWFHDNKGTIKLTDTLANNADTSGMGINIVHKGPVELLRVDSSDNYGMGANINNCNWSGSVCLATGAIKITNSSFNRNGNPTVSLSPGLLITSAGPITLDGVTALMNNGDGLDITFYGPATIKNSVFIQNTTDPVSTDWGYGIYTYNSSTGNLILQNVQLANNQNDGALIRTKGDVTLDGVNAYQNGDRGVTITADEDGTGPGAKTVIIKNSTFFLNGWTNLRVYATGAITATNIRSYESVAYGIWLENTFASTPMPITVNGAYLNHNVYDGGTFYSKGSITLNGIAAINSTTGSGILASTDFPGGTGSITILSTLGTNNFSGNTYNGLVVSAKGNITLNGINADGNGLYGITLNGAGTASAITLRAVNARQNGEWGIYATTNGNIAWVGGDTGGNGTNASYTGGGAYLNNSSSLVARTITVKDVILNDNLRNDGLTIVPFGAVTITNISAYNNAANGVTIDNPLSAGAVSILRAASEDYNNISSNAAYGLYINTKGAVTINNLAAENNQGIGGNINNCQWNGSACVGSGAVTISGTGIMATRFNNNYGNYGLYIETGGVVRLSHVDAQGNYYNGGFISSQKTVTITGIANRFNGNGWNAATTGNGILIFANSSISLTNLEAQTNDGIGLYVYNATGGNVSITASSTWVNRFIQNNYEGLYVLSAGTISLNKVEVMGNNQTSGSFGAYITNTYATLAKTLTITNSTFSNNLGTTAGAVVYSTGPLTLRGVNASFNQGYGINALNNSLPTPQAVTVSNSSFDGNAGVGIYLVSLGNITISNLNARGNQNIGAYFDNIASTTSNTVVMSGVNTFTDNAGTGLMIYSAGIATISGVNTYFNAGDGLYISSSHGIVLSSSRADANGEDGVTLVSNGIVRITGLVSLGNGFAVDYNGLSISANAKVYIYNSTLAGNSGWGLIADVINPTTDVILYNTSTFGNDAGPTFNDGGIEIF